MASEPADSLENQFTILQRCVDQVLAIEHRSRQEITVSMVSELKELVRKVNEMAMAIAKTSDRTLFVQR